MKFLSMVVLVGLNLITEVTNASDEVVVLGKDLDELVVDFNEDRGKVRLLFIIGPTCGVCLRGMADLQEGFLAEMQNNENLQTFAVHVPTMGAELRHVGPTIQLMSGPNITHYWDGDGFIGVQLQERLEIPVYAWDVWLAYGPDAEWKQGDNPPPPDFWQHQLGGVVLGSKLDPAVFGEQVTRLLEKVATGNGQSEIDESPITYQFDQVKFSEDSSTDRINPGG